MIIQPEIFYFKSEISKEDIFESLKLGYVEYRDCLSAGNTTEDLAHVAGYCNTLEQLLTAYGNVTAEEITIIIKPIIGDIYLRRIQQVDTDIDYDVPTVFRKTSS